MRIYIKNEKEESKKKGKKNRRINKMIKEKHYEKIKYLGNNKMTCTYANEDIYKLIHTLETWEYYGLDLGVGMFFSKNADVIELVQSLDGFYEASDLINEAEDSEIEWSVKEHEEKCEEFRYYIRLMIEQIKADPFLYQEEFEYILSI